MPIEHKFKNVEWWHNNEHYPTNDTILGPIHYTPEIMIIGTFNPAQPGNVADFYYGRNYFWPAMFNLFIYNSVNFRNRREKSIPLTPTIADILGFCEQYKLVFSDFISEILHNNNPEYRVTQSAGKRGKVIQEIHYNNNFYNAIVDKDLIQLNRLNQVNWVTDSIIQYLKNHPTIKTVYVTLNPKGDYKKQWEKLCKSDYKRKIDFRRIFTPSGQGSAEAIPKMEYIIRHWLGRYPPNINYEGLDLDWVAKYLSRDIINSF